MLACWGTTKVKDLSSIDSGSPDDVSTQAINAIFNNVNLKKSIFSLAKTFGEVLDKDAVNKVVTDVGKVALGVPFVAVGVQALVVIVNNVVTFEQNKQKGKDIIKYVEFLKQHIEEIDMEEYEEILNESIIFLIKSAWILQQSKNEREGCAKSAWACVRGFLCAQSIASTLDHVALELQQIQRNLNTILLVQANRRQPHFRKRPQLDYDASLYKVGLKTRINYVMQLLEGKGPIDKFQALGVYGIGGIGKSTLLNGLHDYIIRKGYVVTLEVLNEASNEVQVQQNLFKQLTRTSMQFYHTWDGQSQLASEFKKKKKKLCLIFDNLQPVHLTMIQNILPDPVVVCENVAYLIVSAREKHVVERTCQAFTHKRDIYFYEPSLLDESEAKELFCKKAKMHLSQLDSNANDLICNIVPLLGGLPLALEVYGSYFVDEKKRKPEEWKKAMSKLKNAQDASLDDQHKVFKKLEASIQLYDRSNVIDLTDFTDVALFWKEKPWDDAKFALLWEDDEDVLHNLEEKSLVSKSSHHDGIVKMHDILVSVAKSLADHHNNKYYHITKEKPLPIKQKQEQHIRGLSSKEADLSTSVLQKMEFLRFLEIEGNIEIPINLLPHQKKASPRWLIFILVLYLIITIPILSYFFPQSLSNSYLIFFTFLLLPTIMVLAIHMIPFHIWHFHILHKISGQLLPKNLTFLAIHDCHSTIALLYSIGNLKKLRSLNLSKNYGFHGWLPNFLFSNLDKLCLLDLSGCSDLTKIPSTLSKLTYLKTLNLSFCSVLEELPKSLGNLTNLEFIDLTECHSLTCLPDSIGKLTQLRTLKISNCDELSSLPSSFGHLSSLQNLELSRSDNIESLPSSFNMLHSLETLNMSYCSELKALPENFGDLTSLKHLNISGCSSLTSLPHSISKMTNLQSLDASHCIALHDVAPSLFEPLQSTLEDLDFTSCHNLKIGLHFSNKKFQPKSNWKFDPLISM